MVMDGYYTAVAAGAFSNATNNNIMAQSVECPAGSYCSGGVRSPCPAGTFVGTTRRSDVSSCQVCTAGGYCPVGCASPVPCGNDTGYCPAGSSKPAEGLYRGFMVVPACL